jgi:hypothetical protein
MEMRHEIEEHEKGTWKPKKESQTEWDKKTNIMIKKLNDYINSKKELYFIPLIEQTKTKFEKDFLFSQMAFFDTLKLKKIYNEHNKIEETIETLNEKELMNKYKSKYDKNCLAIAVILTAKKYKHNITRKMLNPNETKYSISGIWGSGIYIHNYNSDELTFKEIINIIITFNLPLKDIDDEYKHQLEKKIKKQHKRLIEYQSYPKHADEEYTKNINGHIKETEKQIKYYQTKLKKLI